MELRPGLAGLRQDGAEWANGQQALTRALAAWRREPGIAPVLTAMKRFADGTPLARCKALAALFDTDPARARRFVDALVAIGLVALDGHPLGQLPLLHGSHDAMPSLVLARHGDTTLTLILYDGAALAALPAARTVRFRPIETWARVLAGSGRADRVHLHESADPEGTLKVERVSFGIGDTCHRIGTREALEMREADGAMAVLRLDRPMIDAGPVREFALVDGALLHRSSVRQRDSREALAAALLGHMGRIDAVPALARVALGDGGDAPRWRALGEMLVLDPYAGVELLARIAADAEDSLGDEAGGLLSSLLEKSPELRAALPGNPAWQD